MSAPAREGAFWPASIAPHADGDPLTWPVTTHTGAGPDH